MTARDRINVGVGFIIGGLLLAAGLPLAVLLALCVFCAWMAWRSE